MKQEGRAGILLPLVCSPGILRKPCGCGEDGWHWPSPGGQCSLATVSICCLTGPHMSLSQPAPLPAAGIWSVWLDGGCRVLLPRRKAG